MQRIAAVEAGPEAKAGSPSDASAPKGTAPSAHVAWAMVRNTTLSGVAEPKDTSKPVAMAEVVAKAQKDVLTIGKLRKVHLNMNVTALKLCNGLWTKLFRMIDKNHDRAPQPIVD